MRNQNKYCSKCKTTEAKSYILYSRGANGNKKYFYCTECNSTRAREYRLTNTGKLVYKAIMRKQYETQKIKVLARAVLNTAVREARLKRLPCFCGEIKVDAHHTDYNKPLKVRWLCRPHHATVHRNLRFSPAKQMYA